MDDVRTRRALILAAGLFAIIGATSTLLAAFAEAHARPTKSAVGAPPDGQPPPRAR